MAQILSSMILAASVGEAGTAHIQSFSLVA
jgi:hypothetical protein